MRELLSLEKTRATPLFKGPYVSVSRGFRAGRTLKEPAEEGVLHPALAGLAPFPGVWAHPEAAIRSIRSGRTTVVSTGTGSGKTEAFLYPTVSRCLELRDSGVAPGIVAVLVYPMNALAEGQLGRLRDLRCGTGVSCGMYVGKTPERRADVSGVRLPGGASREEYRGRLAKLREEKRSEAVHPPEERCSRGSRSARRPARTDGRSCGRSSTTSCAASTAPSSASRRKRHRGSGCRHGRRRPPRPSASSSGFPS